MKFVELPVRNIRSHRVRFVLTSLGIAIALAGMLALVGLSHGMERSWILSLQEKGTHFVAVQKGSIDTLAAMLDEGLAEPMRRVPGVAGVMAGIGDLVDLETGQMAYLSGWPLDSDFWRTLKVTQGRPPGASDPEGVVLGETLATSLSKGLGDSIELSGRSFKIVAISRQPSVLDDRSVMIPMPAMQKLLGREGKASGFHVRLQHPEADGESNRVRSRLASAFPTLSFIETSEVGRETLIVRLLHAIAWSSSTIALGMAFVAILNTLLMSVNERTRDLGLLCAVGWSPLRVMTMVLLDGLLLSAAGAALGIGLGLAGLRWITAHPKLGGLFQPEVTPGLVLECVLMALLLGLLGGLYPAWRATRLDPMQLLRNE